MANYNGIYYRAVTPLGRRFRWHVGHDEDSLSPKTSAGPVRVHHEERLGS